MLALAAALGGILFGYDTAVVSGAIGFLTAHFHLQAGLTGWAASSLLVGCMFGAMAVFGQLSGINAIMYFAPEIFKAAGSGTDSAFTQTVIVGVVNLAFTFVAIWLVDRAGRKPLLIAGNAVRVLSLCLVGWLFHANYQGPMLLAGILAFVAAFSVAMGPIPWIVNSEIFPTKLRGRAMPIAIFTLWFADFVVTQTFPMLRESQATRHRRAHLRRWGGAARGARESSRKTTFGGRSSTAPRRRGTPGTACSNARCTNHGRTNPMRGYRSRNRPPIHDSSAII